MVRPLWRKAPLALRHFPSAAVAVIAGSLLASVVVATFPVMLSATASRLLGREVVNSTVSRYGAGVLFSLVEIRYSKRAPGSDGGPRRGLRAASGANISPRCSKRG